MQENSVKKVLGRDNQP